MSNYQDKLNERFTAKEGKELLENLDNQTDALRVAVIATRHFNTDEKHEWNQILNDANKLASDYTKKELGYES
jgi:hypothetical protein